MKGNMDVELAVDVLDLTPHLDHVVLFSGDGDFVGWSRRCRGAACG